MCIFSLLSANNHSNSEPQRPRDEQWRSDVNSSFFLVSKWPTFTKKYWTLQGTLTFFNFSICFSRTTELSIASTSTVSSFSKRYLFTPTMTSDPEKEQGKSSEVLKSARKYTTQWKNCGSGPDLRSRIGHFQIKFFFGHRKQTSSEKQLVT